MLDNRLGFGGRQEILDFQITALKRIIEEAWQHVPFYRKKWQAYGITPKDIHDIDDIHKLPVVSKKDFVQSLIDFPPFGDYQGDYSPMRIQASSGTSGKPVPYFYTKSDWDSVVQLQARRLAGEGVKKGDLMQIILSYSLFIPAFTLTEGAQRIGAIVVPAGSGAVTKSKQQLAIVNEWGSTVLAGIGSYILYLADLAEKEGVNTRNLKVRIIDVSAEILTRDMRDRLREKWGAEVYNNYGTVECGVIGGECKRHEGFHINEDAYLLEILDPKTQRPPSPGEQGSVVITSLYKEAAPIIRYNIGDLSKFFVEPCSCGKSYVRMEPIYGRTDDMIKVKGVTIYPISIEKALHQFPELGVEYMVEISKRNNFDEVKVLVECYDENARSRAPLKKTVIEALKNSTGIQCEVDFYPVGEISRKLNIETVTKRTKLRILDLRDKDQ